MTASFLGALSLQTHPWTPASPVPDVLLPPQGLSLGKPDDSRLFLQSNLTSVIYSVLRKHMLLFSLSLIYLLSQKILDTCGWSTYRCVSATCTLVTFAQLENQLLGRLCPVSAPSISFSFLSYMVSGKPLCSPVDSLSLALGTACRLISGSVVRLPVRLVSVCHFEGAPLHIVLFLVSAWAHKGRDIFSCGSQLPLLGLRNCVHLFFT